MGNNFISRFQAKLVNHTKRLVSHLEAETGVSPGYKVKSINTITIITTSSIVLIIINIITVITGSRARGPGRTDAWTTRRKLLKSFSKPFIFSLVSHNTLK